MKYILIGLTTICSLAGFSQNLPFFKDHIRYTYDNAGNRVKRELIFLYLPGIRTDTVVEPLGNKQIKVYPNPVIKSLSIDVDDYNNEIGNVKVFDVQGKLLINQKITSNRTCLDFIDKEKGAYLVIISINKETKEYTIIK